MTPIVRVALRRAVSIVHGRPTDGRPGSVPARDAPRTSPVLSARLSLAGAGVLLMAFAQLGLSTPLVDALAASGYAAPTPVQQAAIPAALAGTDLMVSSHTGSGKTAAFMLPALQRLAEPPRGPGRGPRVLVLAPTRELAMQVNKAALTYGRGLGRLRTLTLVGGTPYAQQLRMLERPVDIVVATPGRLIDHMERGRVDLSRVELLVLDEADRMLDMGFIEDIERIVARTPAERQTMMFSATLDGVVGQLARRLTRDAQRIDIASTPARRADIEQRLLFADDLGHKTRLLDALLRDPEIDQCLVFAATKRSTEELAQLLSDNGFSVAPLHGDMQQGLRSRTLQGMRDGRTRVLVATDVAARGIDVAGISHVINFDSPRQAEDYVHRIGRTGRAGRSGVAVTLMGHHERHRVRDIERYTGQTLREGVIAGLEPRARPARTAPGQRRGAPAGPARGGRSFDARRPAGSARRTGGR
jgi:superfamily II DNA/RNA helicase